MQLSEYSSMENSNLSFVDIFIVVIILLGVLLVGVYASIQANECDLLKFIFTCGKKRKNKQMEIEMQKFETDETMRSNGVGNSERVDLLTKDENVKNSEYVDPADNFFLANRSMAFYFVGASLFATNIGSEHFIGQAGDGARRGLAVAMYEWYAAILLLLLGWIFAPIYRRSKIYTTPEFLEKRFNPQCRHYLTVITCVMYILTKMSASIYGGAVVLTSALGWNLYFAAGACIVLSALYTISGGLRAVMYTDMLQMMIFVIGGFVVLGIALRKVGGTRGLQEILDDKNATGYWHLFKPINDEDFPVTGMLIGQPIGSLWYWCMDQDLVQRVLSAKDTLHSKAGCVFASTLKILPPFIMIIPGIIAGVLFKFSNGDLADPNAEYSTDHAYPFLLTNLMPKGVQGLMIASIMTAMMSSLDSVFNAGSTIVTNDIYLKIFPHAKHTSMVWVGRLSTVVFALLSFLWIPIIQSGGGLYKKVVEIQAYLTPPLGIVLMVGVCWRGASGKGALTGLLVGGILGMIRLFGVSVAEKEKLSNLPRAVGWYFNSNFQHFAILLWVITGFTCVVVSLFATEDDRVNIEDFVIKWGEIFAVNDEEKKYSLWVRYLLYVAAISVLIVIFTLWIVYA